MHSRNPKFRFGSAVGAADAQHHFSETAVELANVDRVEDLRETARIRQAHGDRAPPPRVTVVVHGISRRAARPDGRPGSPCPVG